MSKRSGNDSKYFTTTKKGEIHELKEELHHQKPEKQKDAVKKVIAAMTVGKDVSMLFTDVINCMQTGNVELKKLVYLYLINYAKSNPDLAILAVNTFRRDANDPNPLIRALSIRTMGCIRVEKITEYLCEPLRRCLKDDDPYVRKTAAVCVAKLHDINPELAEDQGFLKALRDLLADANPSVVANAVAALSEINDNSDDKVFEVTDSVLQKLLAALNECTEWGQVFILDALSMYTPKGDRQAESIIERVTPRLQHANAAVVMSAIKVIVKYLDMVSSTDTVRTLSRKMAPPLVTLLSSEPEIQYVALRNINLIVQKRPLVLSNEIKVFFCKYNDPIYVKMEKLEIMIKLVSERNVEQVLLELKEYATEVDVDFVRRSVRAIGRCAIKLENAAERCINVLLDLIQTKVNYVVQEAIIVIKDIFRKYPNRYESIIATLCENLDTLDEPEAKASMIWIVGEYAERIDNADELLEHFLDSFDDETAEVQLQMLTATVKLFLKRPDGTKKIMENVLAMATEHSDNPDLRDRGYVYWRLLSSDPEAAKRVVLAEKPVIADDTTQMDPSLLDLLINNLSTLVSIYHKPAETFVQKVRNPLGVAHEDDDSEDDDDEDDSGDDDNGASSGGGGVETDDVLGLGDMGISSGSSSTNTNAPSGDLLDFFGGGDSSSASNSGAAGGGGALPQLVDAATGAGMLLRGKLVRENASISLDMYFENQSSATELSQFAVQFNKNTFALAPVEQKVQLTPALGQGQSKRFSVPVAIKPAFASKGEKPSLTIQVAMKDMGSNKVHFFQVPLPFHVLFLEAEPVDQQTLVANWRSLVEGKATTAALPSPLVLDDAAIRAKFQAHNVYFVLQRSPQRMFYYSLRTTTGSTVYVELNMDAGTVQAKCEQAPVLQYVVRALCDLMTN